MRRWLREPIVHFVVIGGMAFAAREAWERGRADGVRADGVRADGSRADGVRADGVRADGARADGEVIVVSRATRGHVVRELEASLGRAATVEEKQAALERWKVDEAAYREGERLGYLRDDEAVRARLVARVRDVYRGLEQLPVPSEGELEGFLRENRARYELPERFVFEHAFASREKVGAGGGSDGGAEAGGDDAEARAKGFLAAVARGEELSRLGDDFPGGRQVDAVFEEVAREFGFGFATELAKASPGGVMVLEGTRGMHAVRLVRRVAPVLPPLAELRPRVLRDYLREKEGELGERAMRRIRAGYRFVEGS